MDVILQAGPWMTPAQIHGARRHQKMLVDQMNQPVSEAGREVRPEVGRAVFVQPARHIDAWVFLERRVTDVGIGLVVAQEDVELRHVPLDEIVFKRQRLFLVVHDDVVKVGNFANERTGLGVLPARFEEVRFDAAAQRARLSDVEDFARRRPETGTHRAAAGS